MAKVRFLSADGTEASYTLEQTRSLRIGRDPGNDVVLRDAKASRHHAQIIFEKGFFVLYDLSSANGSFVNGKRIRVAPLTDGAELKIGNSLGKFFDEAPAAPGATVMADLAQLRRPVDEQSAEKARDPEPELPIENLETLPHDKAGRSLRDEIARSDMAGPEWVTSPAMEKPDLGMIARTSDKGAHEPPTEMLPVLEDEPRVRTREAPAPKEPDARFRLSKYLIDLSGSYGEKSWIRDDQEKAIFYFRRPLHVTSFVAGLVSAMILLAGVATAILLGTEGQILFAVAAFAMTIAFCSVILLLVPRRQIQIFDDDALTAVAITLWQESRIAFPSLRFSARLADGALLASFEKNWFSNLARRKWWIFDKYGMTRTGFAKEDSLLRSTLRRILGNFFGSLRTNYKIFVADRYVGVVNRRATALERYFLDLSEDTGFHLDRRVALALAVLIDAVEMR